MQRLVLVLVFCGALASTVSVRSPHAGKPTPLAGLKAGAQITRDSKGVAHLQATNEHDLYFLQGYMHAQDRFFQMDFSRHQAAGRLAELLGPVALATDVQLRTFGIRRAAARSLAAYSPRARAALEAYAEGVNASLASNPLPPEYTALELTRVDLWTALDSAAVLELIAFGLSFDLSDIDRTVALFSYRAAGAAVGFDGTKLFFEDLFRSAPFDPAATIPDASAPIAMVSASRASHASDATVVDGALDEAGVELARGYLQRVKDAPLVRRYLERDRHASSNAWAVSGSLTASGFAMVASDPHLALGTPATWYPIDLHAGPIDVIGNSFAGVPFIIHGHNRHIAWGSTLNPMDVTDVYQEQVVVDLSSPSHLSIVHAGQIEPIIPIPEVFRANQLDGVTDNLAVASPGGSIPPVTLIVPRRNDGPIISLDLASGTALSVQYTGFSATRELEAFMLIDEAKDLADFTHALQLVDVGSQNFAYADVDGNIAYFTSAEMPIREDLQAGIVAGLPPYVIRNGVVGNEWLPLEHPQPNQAVPYEILPSEEMPHIVNPTAGFFVNANNDPTGATLDNDPFNQLRAGGGIYYLSPGYDGFRAGRATALIHQKLTAGRLSFEDMQEMQADTVMIDASVFVPYILGALDRAQAAGAHPSLAALGANPAIAEAVSRLRDWNFSTPTGIPQGFDASDENGVLSPPPTSELAASVAATIYSVWRGQILRNTVDAPLTAIGLAKPGGRLAVTALRNLLDRFATAHGIGGSGVNFFNVPGVANPADRRDILILRSLKDALGLLASPQFAAAYGESTNQADYRWGKLHRIVFSHALDGPFSIPPAGGAFPQRLAGLPGIPADGGFETLDRSDHDVRAATVNAFMFSSGPSQRSVHESPPSGMRGVSALPGGPSGVPGSPFYLSLLPSWLTNDAYPLLDRESDLEHETLLVMKFVPAGK